MSASPVRSSRRGVCRIRFVQRRSAAGDRRDAGFRAASGRRTGFNTMSLIVRFARLLLLAAVLAGCASAPHRPLEPATPVPTATPHPIHLPADDAPHDDLTEWWYYTGHLDADGGQAYGFEMVIFQVERQGAPIFYAAHFAITDHQRREFHYAQRTWTADRAPATFDLRNGDWGMTGEGSFDALKATMPGYAIDL